MVGWRYGVFVVLVLVLVWMLMLVRRTGGKRRESIWLSLKVCNRKTVLNSSLMILLSTTLSSSLSLL